MPAENSLPALPIVLCTTVVRSAHHGSSHGGAYLVDLASGRHRQMLDWNDDTIDWNSRGARHPDRMAADTNSAAGYVNLSLDIRNAVHGLVIWPFSRIWR